MDSCERGKNRETREGQRDRVPSPSSLPPSPLAGEGRGEGACSHAVIPDISNAVIPDVSHPVIPDISNTVIPDVINRESKAKVRGLDSRRVQRPPPTQNGHDRCEGGNNRAYRMREKRNNAGFPLKPAGMTEGGPAGRTGRRGKGSETVLPLPLLFLPLPSRERAGVRGLALTRSFPTFQTRSFPTFQTRSFSTFQTLSFPMFLTLSFLTFLTLSFPTFLIGNPRPG